MPGRVRGGFREGLYRRAAERAAALPAEVAVDWIGGHGLLGLADYPATPEALRPALRRLRLHNAGANLHRVARFQELVDALGDLPVCPLKGILLLATLYADDPACRVLADLDLLVPEADVDRAVERLTQDVGMVETPVSRAAAAYFHHRFLVWDGLDVEIHGRLGVRHGYAATWAALAPRPARVHDRDVWALDGETTLLHLVLHFVKHDPFSSLRWVEDVFRAVDAGVDEARLIARARKLGAFRTLAAGVGALGRLAGESFLPGVAGATTATDRARATLAGRLLGSGPGRDPLAAAGRRTPTALGRNFAALLLADRPRDALAIARVKAGELWHRRRARF